MELFDQKFKANKGWYVIQCLLAMVSVLVVLIVLKTISSAAIIASLGASAFIVFTLPKTEASRPKVMIGAYIIGVAIGTGCYWLAQLVPVTGTVAKEYVTIAFAAAAVGSAIFLMTVTNTEHAPATGIALGLVIQEWHWAAVAVVLVGCAGLCLAKWLLRSWLKNLA